MKKNKLCLLGLMLISFSYSCFASVTLFNFGASQNIFYTDIYWQTSSEINNDYFTLERSTDTINWTPIYTATGAGTTSLNTNYSYTDSTATPLGQTYYYRLVDVEFSGAFQVSYIINFINLWNSVEQELQNLNLILYPNPSSKTVTIEGLTKPYNLTIYNAVGQLLFSQNNIAATIKQIDVSNYPKGLLFIRIEAEGEVYSYKLIKEQ